MHISIFYILTPGKKMIINEGSKVSINLNACFVMNINVRSYFAVPKVDVIPLFPAF